MLDKGPEDDFETENKIDHFVPFWPAEITCEDLIRDQVMEALRGTLLPCEELDKSVIFFFAVSFDSFLLVCLRPTGRTEKKDRGPRGDLSSRRLRQFL